MISLHQGVTSHMPPDTSLIQQYLNNYSMNYLAIQLSSQVQTHVQQFVTTPKTQVTLH